MGLINWLNSSDSESVQYSRVVGGFSFSCFAELMSWSRVSRGQFASRQEQTGQLSPWGLLCVMTKTKPPTHTHTYACIYTCTCCTHTHIHTQTQALVQMHRCKCTDAGRKLADGHSHMQTQPPQRCTDLKTHTQWHNLSFSVPLLSRPEVYFCSTKAAEPQRNTIMLYWGQEAWARKPGYCK